MPRARRSMRCWRRCFSRSPDAQLLRAAWHACAAMPARSAFAHAALGEARPGHDAERVGREYFDLFIGLGRGEILPYALLLSDGFPL